MIALPEVFTASVTALRRNKTRSMLTALGIIIGVAAVIAAFAVGAGANKSIDEQISSFGSNFIMVFPDRSSRSTMGSRSYLTDEDAEAIAREVSGIDAVAPMINLSATVVYENTNWDTSVVGSTADYSYVQDWSIAYGRDINQSDVRQGAKVIVIGSTVEEKLFPDTSALGKSIRVNKIPFTVIGVFEAKGLSAMGSDQDDFMLVPITAAQRRLVRWREAGRIGNIYIKGVSMTALNYIQNETEALLRERHRIMPGEPDDFAVRNVSQMLERDGARHTYAVPDRGGRPLDGGRDARNHSRRRRGLRALDVHRRAARIHARLNNARLRLLRDGRRRLRLLSGLQGLAAEPDRRSQIRIKDEKELLAKLVVCASTIRAYYRQL